MPSPRRYLLRLRTVRPAGIVVDGGEPLGPVGPTAAAPGWWMDDEGFLCVRPPERPALTVVVTPA